MTHSNTRYRLWPFLAFATIFGLLSFLRNWFDDLAGGTHESPWPILADELLAGWIAGVLLWGLFLLCQRIPPNRIGNLVLYLSLGPVFAIIHTLGMYASRSLLYPLAGWGSYDYGSLVYRIPMEAPVQLLVYALAIAAFVFIERGEKARESDRLRAQLAESRLEALKLKLAPHFLFNAMNTISSVVYDDPARADDLIGRLARILRSLLAADQSADTTLAQEFDLLQEYLEIQRARFEQQLVAVFDLPEELSECRTPFMILQPLVENALKHGMNAEGKVEVTVRACRDGQDLVLTVTDAGTESTGDLDPEKSAVGVGLSNVRERLRNYYGDSASFSLSRNPKQPGSQARICMPCEF